MNGAIIGVALLLLAAGGVGTFALMGGPTGDMMGGGSMTNCANMHPGTTAGHAQCDPESRMGSHASCDAMGMTPAQCQQMQSYMAGAGMSGSCH